MVILPPHEEGAGYATFIREVQREISNLSARLGPHAVLIVVGDPLELVHVHPSIQTARFQLWINIKRQTPIPASDNTALPAHHFGATVYTCYAKSLVHTDTRIEYTYCPACDKTTKDYGGKKHTYNSYGTLISDVWRDIACDLEGDLSPVIKRFADLFGLERYQELHIFDCRPLWQAAGVEKTLERKDIPYQAQPSLLQIQDEPVRPNGKLILGDCLESLRQLEDNSVDFAFIDPPYNLGKTYNSYTDDLSIQEYFTWCDQWIAEVTRILRPGRTLAILNIPLWAIRHFLYMETILKFQNWIAWDALSFPVRRIMPAHYAIICFSKGEPRPLPGLIGEAGKFAVMSAPDSFSPLQPMAEGYCLRAGCIKQRNAFGFTDRGGLTDLWWDIHRLKHNSRRVDHPCQLPPHLMYRLISIFTRPNETVLDCFNGAGTTSLTAHQMGRGYIGIELSEKYHEMAAARHREIEEGLDPFRKEERTLTEKNSHVARMPKVVYEVPKKTLQLEVRRIALELGRLPTRDEVIEFGNYPICYYDEYFASWGEVCAAARHDGMTEVKSNGDEKPHLDEGATQLTLFGELNH
ncbi:MAG: site-specific DNA-methyltransferase [Caldilineaceae bacterium]|nr:site-specific DNA-methyltransferase [Caldilineaceae bacterium]